MNCRNLIKKLASPLFIGLLTLTAFQALAVSTPKTAGSGVKVTQHPKKPKRLAGGVAYFIDFGVDTYAGVTPQTISKDGEKISLNAAQMRRVKSILRKRAASGQFESDRVRLSLSSPDQKEVIFVSEPGVVWDAQGQYTLPPAAVTELNQMMIRLLKQQNHKKQPSAGL